MSLMSDIATAIKNKFILNDFYSQSNSLLTGGGTISVSATWEVKWSTRFITVSNGRGVSLATGGYFDITMPAVSTVITGAGGATNKTVTANGIPLGAYETLYYILPLGATNTTVNANFRVCSYTADINIPNNWIKICSKNDDGGYVDFACGVSLRNNTSINTHLYDVKGADVDGAVSSANVLATARTIATSGDVVGTATSFNGSANITIPMTLANSGVTAGTYSKMTVDAKGRVTAGFTQTMEDIPDATFKRSVKAATTANITLSAPQTIDGVALVAGDRVLVKNQTTTSQNGIYVVAAAAWTRSLDADSASKIASALVAVDTGTVNGGKLFDNDFKITDTLGTTAMQWSMNLDDGSLLTSGSTSIGTVRYNGTTAVAGQFDGGTTTPTGTVRLNYGGYFYPSYINLTGSADTTITSSHVFVEAGSDGYVRPKTLANFKTEMFASPTLVTPNIGVATGTSFNSITGLSTVVGTTSGTAAVGTSTTVARADHVHPSDTTKVTKVTSTDKAIVRFNRDTGDIQNSGVVINDNNAIINNSAGLSISPANGGATSLYNWLDTSSLDIWAGTSQKTGIHINGQTASGGSYFSVNTGGVQRMLLNENGMTITGAISASTNFIGALTGNAGTATTLQTARTINGVSFNGSANITISDSTKVALTGNETIAGIKTFSSSPIVPTPTTDTQATNKAYVDGKYSGFKNYIINGNFDIWQRGTSQTTSGYGSSDRWVNFNTGSTKTTSMQITNKTEPFNSVKFCRNVVSSVAGAGNAVGIQQRIEWANTLHNKTCTLSFYAKADTTKNIAIDFVQHFGSGGTPSATIEGIAATKIQITSSWAKYTITANIPSIVGKSAGTDGNDSFWVRFWFDAGSDHNTRSNNLGQQSGTFDIAQVQLEEGSVATPFEQRPIGLELSLCQRYYEEGRAVSVSYGDSGAAIQRGYVSYSIGKRSAPSVILTKNFGVATGGVVTSGDVTGFSFGYNSTGAGQEWLGTYTSNAEL